MCSSTIKLEMLHICGCLVGCATQCCLVKRMRTSIRRYNSSQALALVPHEVPHKLYLFIPPPPCCSAALSWSWRCVPRRRRPTAGTNAPPVWRSRGRRRCTAGRSRPPLRSGRWCRRRSRPSAPRPLGWRRLAVPRSLS